MNEHVTNCLVTGFSEWVADSKESPLILLYVIYPETVNSGTLNLRVVGLNPTLESGNELSHLIFCLLFTNKICKQSSQNRGRLLIRPPAATPASTFQKGPCVPYLLHLTFGSCPVPTETPPLRPTFSFW